MPGGAVTVVGLPQLLQQFEHLSMEVGGSRTIHDATMQAARQVAKRVRAEAPRGPTGNLRRSIQSGGYKRRMGKPIAAFVRANRRIAPHLHLVHFGARGGQMPSNPFFDRGVLAMRSTIPGIIAKGAGAAIDKAIR